MNERKNPVWAKGLLGVIILTGAVCVGKAYENYSQKKAAEEEAAAAMVGGHPNPPVFAPFSRSMSYSPESYEHFKKAMEKYNKIEGR